jgi:hypothetical protein
MADDSSLEGWLTPPAPLPPGVMDYPTGRKLDSPPAKGLVGTMPNGIEADEGSIAYAARHWPQRKLNDFHIADRVWRDRATGEQYRVVRGNPLLGLGHESDTSVADCFVVASGLLWFLKNTAAPATRSTVLGSVGAS